ncbi:MAG: glycogen-binding domain-containing protein, partial [Deltaproteobacteria bacterium]|nr:glycogen-binding domain-containing protein [Deltaproteobacteria bacterium]
MELQPGCLRWGEPVACPGTLTCDGGECRVGCTSDPECDAAGRVGCADDGHERACEEVAPGCLKWGAAVACPLHQGCGADGCACADVCAAGTAECIPDVDPHFRKVCDADDAGCLHWAYEDCGGGSVCEDGACVALCGSDPGCTAEGVTRCESLDSFSTCAAVEGDADCIQFGAPAPCAEHQECIEATGACACRVEAGCSTADAKRCIDYDNAATCLDDGGCLYWGPAEPCPEGNTCSDGVCGPLCVSDLDCGGVGAKRCADDGRQQECVEVPGRPGCNKWAPTQACPPHQACAEGTGCVCDNTCKTGESRCVGRSQYQSCSAPDAASCTFWSAPEPCPAGESCVKGACRLVVSPVVDCGSITFNLVNAGYSEVQVAGEFSAWQSVPMTLTDGIWSATVEVPLPGAWEYKFVADGTWLLDPLNPSWTGEGPFENSIAFVEAVTTCEAAGAARCTDGGALQVCAETAGCTAWKPADD